MPRPREFDETDVVERALRVFWAKGYHGTSVSDLEEATGLGRASLYGAFGDKARLFERALEHYVEKSGALLSLLQPEGNLKAGLRRFYGAMVDSACANANPRGCFLLQSTMMPPEDSRVAATFKRVRSRTEDALSRGLEAAKRSGLLARDADPRALAQTLMVFQHGLAASARVGRPRTELKAAVETMIERVFA